MKTTLITVFSLLTMLFSAPLMSAENQAISSTIEKSVEFDPAESCLDEFRARRNGLIGINAGAPFGGAAATLGIMFLGARIEQALVPGAFLSGLAGAVLGMFAGAALYVGVQGVLIYKLVKPAQMISAIKSAKGMKSLKAMGRLAKKLERKFGPFQTKITAKLVQDKVLALDKSGALCDASLVSKRRQRKFERKGKMRNALAYKKDLLKHLAQVID